MRCPKCSYLSYDDVERCRNCGYDFALATTPREPDAAVPEDPVHEPRPWEPPARRRRGVGVEGAPVPEGSPLDLPLFGEAAPEPPPVVIPPAGPPLSVRRKIEISRQTPRVEPSQTPAPATVPEFEWPDDEATAPELPTVTLAGESSRPPADLGDAAEASLAARLRAGAIDAGLLLAIDLVVVWLTLRVAGVATHEWRIVPLVPLAGFLFLLDTAYLVTFTAASGQTIGKMLTGLRVVHGEASRVPFGHAVLRSVAVLLCALPVGLGLLPLILDQERRGAHDRLAGTRVVPAP